MSIRFKSSHQHVGLNRIGKYLQPCSVGGWPASTPGKIAGQRPALRNEKWRRITNIVGRNIETFTIKQRKAGIRRLVGWMEEKLKSDLNRRDAEAQRSEKRTVKIGVLGDWGSDVEKWGGVKHAGRS